jgi:lipoprotein-anchoring transpeptidase ErfK/SrfK
MIQKTAAPIVPSDKLIIILLLLVTFCLTACKSGDMLRDNEGKGTAQSEQSAPTIEAAPTSKADEQWQVISSDSVTLNVTAPGAQSVRVLYRPAFEDRHVLLKKLTSPSEPGGGKFSTQLKVPSDFVGEVWAEASYANGEKRKAKPISLTAESISATELADASYKHSDESARSDKITGGTIEKTSLQPGQPDLRITVNIPAFQLTLWQGGKEVKTYQIGIGRKEFPLPNELRRATQIVFNPDWIPPDSSWVEEHDVVPGERVEADDPRNPLGKIKIPLGKGILIHQASGPSDLGHLVSHGCVRLLTDDLFDLSEKIIAARSLNVTKQQIEHARNSKDRLAVQMDAPLIVDLNYDTQVVEGGVLHLYPDVYNHKTNTIENLRAELQGVGLDSSKLDDQALRQMLSRVTMAEEFFASIADIKLGRALASGKNQPLTAASTKKERVARTKRRA